MAEYLLDSNHASPLVTLDHPLRERVLYEMIEGHTFSICVPTLTETLFGISMLPRAEANIQQWQRTLTCQRCWYRLP